MNLRQYLTIMSIATVLCVISWGVVLLNIDPFETTSLGLLLFYVSLFFVLIGVISLISFALYRRRASHDLPMYRYVKFSFRDGLAGASLIIGLLYLRAHGLLTLWNFGIVIGIIILIIAFSFSARKTPTERLFD